MFGTILKATNSSFQKGMTFCRSIYVKKVMKLLAFIFEQPSYVIREISKRAVLYLQNYQILYRFSSIFLLLNCVFTLIKICSTMTYRLVILILTESHRSFNY